MLERQKEGETKGESFRRRHHRGFFLSLCVEKYRVYHKFRPNLGKRIKMIIFGSLLTSFKVISIFLRVLEQYQKLTRA